MISNHQKPPLLTHWWLYSLIPSKYLGLFDENVISTEHLRKMTLYSLKSQPRPLDFACPGNCLKNFRVAAKKLDFSK
jgi:hypothetical protein